MDLNWRDAGLAGRKLMPRHMFCNALAAVLIGAAATYPAAAQDILVTGPAERVVDRTIFGADVVEYTASLTVDVRDLDLATAAGWSAMEKRVASASHVACNVVEQRASTDLSREGSECERNAYRGGIARVREIRKLPAS